jgi:cell division protein FtsI/penicillin-binding protein 2
MNRQIRQLAVVLMALYVVLFGALNYWQVGREEALATEPGNTRALIRKFDSPRGPIVSSDGVVVARSVQAPGDSNVKYVRSYPTNDLFAHITGYHTFGLGSTQIEKTQTDVLSGTTFEQQVGAIGDIFTGATDQSGEVRLTVSEELQAVAKFLLGPREGSIVLMEVETGAVNAMWSYPSFDPNLVASPTTTRPTTTSSSCRPTSATRCSPTRTSSATCPARRSRCSPPASRSTRASCRSRASSRASRSSPRPRPTTRSRTTAAPCAAAT